MKQLLCDMKIHLLPLTTYSNYNMSSTFSLDIATQIPNMYVNPLNVLETITMAVDKL